MRLSVLEKAPEIHLHDIHGNRIEVGQGKPTLLVFFRDAACPFCNLHLYRLTQKYAELHEADLEVIAVFASSPREVEKFILARPRPFPIAAEPLAEAYEIYGLEKSFWGKLKAVLIHFPKLLNGLSKLGLTGSLKGMAGVNTTNRMPADFLIHENGRIAEAYYGKDAADHISFERIELFLAQHILHKQKQTKHNEAVNNHNKQLAG